MADEEPRPLGDQSTHEHGGRAPSAAELAAATRVGPLFALERVGGGSFGQVYRAWDPNLQREVALKVLNRSPAEGRPAPSILSEGQLLAKIRHPNVMAVYGAESLEDRVIIWSEFLRGRTLADLVKRDGPLGPQEAVVIGDAVCRALAAVHRAGLLHRDIKAQNVMREAGGRIVLMDFGLGREEGATWAGDDMAGTPLYLAPELFEHHRATRQSDIYSVGVLLFYLVTGTFPVEGRSIAALMLEHRAGRRRLLQEARPDLPASFCQVVERAIDPEPDARFESIGSFQQSLVRSVGLFDSGSGSSPNLAGSVPVWTRPRARGRRALQIAAAAGVVLLLGAAAWLGRPRETPVVSGPPSVAVLPLRNTSGDPAKDFFANALTHEVISKLWKLGSVRVIAPTSSMAYANATDEDLRRIASELGVRTVVNGSVSWIGDRVRVVAGLVDVEQGASLWSDSYDRDVADILDVQSDISQRVAEALGAHLSATDRTRVRQDEAVDFETYQLYLQGRYQLSQRSPSSVDAAIASFEAAIGRTPAYAAAHAALATALTVKWGLGYNPDELEATRERARAEARRALALDEGLAEAHLALAFVRWGSLEWEAAGASFERALTLNPGDAQGHHWYATYLVCLGRMDEAIEHVTLARELDPVNVRTNSAVGWVYYQAREYARAVQQLEASLAIDPGLAAARGALGIVHSLEGRHDEAVAELERAVALVEEDPETGAMLAYALARAGRADAARTQLARSTREEGRATAGAIAAVHLALGDTDAAFAWLERSIEARDIWAAHLKVDPRLDPLRGDPRFDAFLRRVGLADAPAPGIVPPQS